MKSLALLFSFLLSMNLLAKQSITIHYLGDTKPITLDVPVVVNKDGVDTKTSKKITLNFDQATTLGLNADLTITIEKENVQIEGTSINKSLIKAIINEENKLDTKIDLSFMASDEIMSPLKYGMTDPEIKNNELQFVAGNLSNKNLYKLSIKILQKKFLKKDELIVEKEITENDMTIEKITETQNRVTVDLNKLTNGNFKANAKNEISVKLGINYDFKNIINLKQIGKIIVEKNGIFHNIQ